MLSVAVPSSVLRKKRDMLLSGKTANREERTLGFVMVRPGRLSPPAVWRG